MTCISGIYACISKYMFIHRYVSGIYACISEYMVYMHVLVNICLYIHRCI